MQDPDGDVRFERYLKEFRPLAPDPLVREERRGMRARPFVLRSLAAVAAVCVVVFSVTHHRPRRTPLTADKTKSEAVEILPVSQLLTIRSANKLLTSAPSLRAAIDLVAFQPQSTQLPKGMRSAFTTLGKEDSKL